MTTFSAWWPARSDLPAESSTSSSRVHSPQVPTSHSLSAEGESNDHSRNSQLPRRGALALVEGNENADGYRREVMLRGLRRRLMNGSERAEFAARHLLAARLIPHWPIGEHVSPIRALRHVRLDARRRVRLESHPQRWSTSPRHKRRNGNWSSVPGARTEHSRP